jgi:phage tail-like protein
MHNQRLQDSAQKAQFYVEIDGIQATNFKKVDGLKASYGVVEERDGNEPNRKRKQRGIETFDNVTLTKGVTMVASDLEKWYLAGDRRSVSIVQMSYAGEEIRRWNLINAFPIEYTPIEGMDSDSDAVQIETLVLAHEGFETK